MFKLIKGGMLMGKSTLGNKFALYYPNPIILSLAEPLREIIFEQNYDNLDTEDRLNISKIIGYSHFKYNDKYTKNFKIRTTFFNISKYLKNKYGELYFLDILQNKIEKYKKENRVIIIDDIRRDMEFEYIITKNPDLDYELHDLSLVYKNNLVELKALIFRCLTYYNPYEFWYLIQHETERENWDILKVKEILENEKLLWL
jgi:hypothetical protein